MSDLTPDDTIDLIGRSIQHPNPLFDFLTTFVPRKLKTMFQYCEYLYINCPQVFAALNKFATYPVTELNFKTENPTIRTKYEKLCNETLHLKNYMILTAIDKWIYGNSFVSMYFPFRRFLVCPTCKHEFNIKYTEYKFRLTHKTPEWRFKCEACGKTGAGTVHDRHIQYPAGIKVIRWDAKHIEIVHNPITDEREYYYSIPPELQDRIRKGDRHVLNTTPLEVINTVASKRLFKFAPGKIYHMRARAPAGIDNRWGLPPLVSTIKQFYYVSVLRKANEAIALEHIIPFRVLHPEQPTNSSDPTITISLANWVNETKLNMKAWRKDPLHLMFSPIPVGVTQIGGQGRALMVTGEINEAENNIIASMGIPREFIYGGLSATGGGVTLRMLENQLLNDITDLIDEAQWIVDQCGKFMGWSKINIGLEDFKLVDDVQQKSMLLQANQIAGGALFSNTSLAEMFGRDLDDERKLRLQEQLDESQFQNDLQRRIQEQQQNISDQARQQSQMGAQQYDQQQIWAQANELAQQFLGLDPGTRRSQLHALQMEDMVMYSVVIQALEQMQTDQATQARQMVAQGGGAPPPGAM